MAGQTPSSLELPEWPWTTLRRPSWHEKAFDILKDFVETKDSGANYETAYHLAELMPEPEQEHGRMDDGELNLGDFIRAIASQLPYTSPTHVRLVSVFMCLGRMNTFSTLSGQDGKTVTRNITRAWKKDLLYLTPWFDYKSARGHAFVPETFEIEVSGMRSRSVSAAAFDARLLSAGLHSGEQYDRWVMTDLRIALETKPERSPEGAQERHKETWRAEVLGAAMQPIFAGQMLFDCIVIDPITHDQFSGLYEPGELYQGPAWGIERWRFWRQRFTDIAVEERDADVEVSKVCYKAADMMLAIERNYLY